MTPAEQQRAVDHVLGVLGGGPSAPHVRDAVAYAPLAEAPPAARVVIVPSRFFGDGVYGTFGSLPNPPLEQIGGTPLLFGEPHVERQTGPDGRRRMVVQADIVASAYFLLTRYEEMVRRDVRDGHGRFSGRESLPFRCGFLQRPIVDEYAALLRTWLREAGVEVAEPPSQIRKIHLTHDLDAPWAWPNLRSAFKSAVQDARRRPAAVLKPFLGVAGLQRDPFDCFSWLREQDGTLRDELGPERVDITYFLLAGGGGSRDGADYLTSRRSRKLSADIQQSGARLGLHSSYSAGRDPRRISAERERVQQVTGTSCTANRHHFLALREPEDMELLEAAGITDDFTMGYADVAGFRLGTCRPVSWFDPVALRPTGLTVHPLTLMDCTLDRAENMNLDYARARAVCLAMLAEVRKHHGEAVLLWHNTELAEGAAAAGSYQRRLYADLLAHLKESANGPCGMDRSIHGPMEGEPDFQQEFKLAHS